MAQASRTFRIFVSSTFSDLKEERNALQERVFPRLRELCATHGARFQAIDLRWGVSEEAALDQRTMAICLDEIARCRRASPRPNFIVLLGDRYGWRPLPPRIPADELEQILGPVSPDEQARLRSWYLRDDNAVPPEYVLRPREREYEDHEVWSGVERDLHQILRRAVADLPLEAQDRLKYVASATEQEIAEGALRVADAEEHVFCFFREIDGLPRDSTARDFVDLDELGRPDREAAERLERLKDLLRGRFADHVHEYHARWTGSGVTDDHLEALCEDVFRRLAALVEREISQLEAVDPLEKELADQDRFRRERAAVFVGRADPLRAIGDYVVGGDRHPLAIHGASGSGKSALLARAAEQVRQELPAAQLVVRFIGATPASSDGRALLDSLCHQISRRYGADEATIPTDYRGLVEELPKRLALATAERPLVVVLDALDQLSDVEQARSLAWLPGELTEHVRLIVSTLPGECLAALERKLPASSLARLEPLGAEEGRVLLDRWLADAGRTLQAHQREEVLGKFARNGLPLYLKLAFEEARGWHSFTDPGETVPAPTIPGVIRDLFDRLSAEANHGAVLVSRSLGYLAAAKSGLSEDELLDVLSADPAVLADFKRRSPHSPAVDRLPVVIWSRLSFDLEPYLAERSADDATLLGFYHRQLEEVVAEDFLAGDDGRDRHRALAAYFAGQELELVTAGRTIPNLRKLSELPYQQTLGALWDDLFATLTDFRFLERKAATGLLERRDAKGTTTRTYSGVFALQDDFDLALREWPSDGRGQSRP